MPFTSSTPFLTSTTSSLTLCLPLLPVNVSSLLESDEVDTELVMEDEAVLAEECILTMVPMEKATPIRDEVFMH